MTAALLAKLGKLWSNGGIIRREAIASCVTQRQLCAIAGGSSPGGSAFRQRFTTRSEQEKSHGPSLVAPSFVSGVPGEPPPAGPQFGAQSGGSRWRES